MYEESKKVIDWVSLVMQNGHGEYDGLSAGVQELKTLIAGKKDAQEELRWKPGDIVMDDKGATWQVVSANKWANVDSGETLRLYSLLHPGTGKHVTMEERHLMPIVKNTTGTILALRDIPCDFENPPRANFFDKNKTYVAKSDENGVVFAKCFSSAWVELKPGDYSWYSYADYPENLAAIQNKLREAQAKNNYQPKQPANTTQKPSGDTSLAFKGI